MKKTNKKNIKDTKTTEPIIRYEKWINSETGEEREFAVVDKPYHSDYNFHKVWLEDLAHVLGILGGAKIAVFSEILGMINPYSNEVGFTHEELAKKAKVGRNTVQETIKKLIEADFIRKVRVATYKVNPKMLVKGTHNKRMGLLLKYDELNDGRQLEAFPKNEIEKW